MLPNGPFVNKAITCNRNLMRKRDVIASLVIITLTSHLVRSYTVSEKLSERKITPRLRGRL